jgi:hypothetical protein
MSMPTDGTNAASGCPPHTPYAGGSACYAWEGNQWTLVENHCDPGYQPSAPTGSGTDNEHVRTQCVLSPANA